MKVLLRPATAPIAAVTGLLVAVLVVWLGVTKSIPSSQVRGEPVGADAPAYVRIARSLLKGTLELPPPERIDQDRQQRLSDPFGTPYALGRDGRLLPKHSVAFAALFVPGVRIGGFEGAVFTATLLGAALAAFVTARSATVFGALPAFAAAFSLFVLTPGGRWIVTGVNIDTAVAGAMVAAFALAAGGRTGAAGAVAGLSPLLRPTAVLLLLPAVLVAPRKSRRQMATRFAVGLFAGAAATAFVHTWMWGAPWRTGYDRALVFVDGASQLAPHSTTFGADPLKGLVALFFDPSAGFAVLAPAALLALAGYLLPAARRAEWVMASASALLSLLLLASYSFVQAVPAGNYRFGLPLLVSAVPALAALFSAATRQTVPAPNAVETTTAPIPQGRGPSHAPKSSPSDGDGHSQSTANDTVK